MPFQYAVDAARLLERCQSGLTAIFEEIERCHSWRRRNRILLLTSLKNALQETEQSLNEYILNILKREKTDSECLLSTKTQQMCSNNSTATLDSNASLLLSIIQNKRKKAVINEEVLHHRIDANNICCYPERNASGSLLFRLSVVLQLCLIRINDAHRAMTGQRENSDKENSASQFFLVPVTVSCTFGVIMISHIDGLMRKMTLERYASKENPIVSALAHFSLAFISCRLVHTVWKIFWISNQVSKCTKSISDWNLQWRVIQSITPISGDLPEAAHLNSSALVQANQTQKLIDYALKEPTKISFWQSQGEIRFILLKHAMDVFYASVGTAMNLTKSLHGDAKCQTEPDWQLTLVAAAASSFYSLIGASRKAAEVTSSSLSAQALIQNAWGMMSLPSIKTFSLTITRLLKGAAVADRIDLCGVSCFVLSADPAPELAVALCVFSRKKRRNSVHTMSTIDERFEQKYEPQSKKLTSIAKPFAGAESSSYRQRDVIFHLTGGGFFAHIIASDLLYLLDWSSSTGAVVICPEYGILPDHCFPDALIQVTDVYRSLAHGEANSLLGFEVNHIILTGESAGGNLAAALCIVLGNQRIDSLPETTHFDVSVVHSKLLRDILRDGPTIPFPNALMMSCPVLNLSLELSHSRVVGTNDPVLPSGLLTAISDAYVPPHLGIGKRNALVSPFFATNEILSQFPPTLLIASSNDPLLDDSVAFNQRLRQLGVESQLRASDNLPHAFLGLGTAGFPEAEEAQQECQAWLISQLSRQRLEQ